ncbi:MAG: Threonine--tRNA ligase [Pseudomonadota bacterium]
MSMPDTKAPQSATSADYPLHTKRHSCAHVMAAALQKLYPTAKFGVGPAIDQGFFYDVSLEHRLLDEDLAKIEAEMRRIVKKKEPFLVQMLPIDEAIAEMKRLNQPYKIELLKLLKEKGSTAVAKETGDDDAAAIDSTGTVSFYKTGDFVDLCRGPHVKHTGQIGAFKLTQLAGAYWRGNEKNDQLQRIYGLCFDTKADLEQALWRIEQAKLRDHRKIGKELRLFTFSEEVGPGLPLWLPKGVVLRDELEYLARQEERKDGYERVVTSHITKEALYYKSGHLPYYKEDMYAPIDIEGDNYYLRPMNCPHHHQVYLANPHSYRQLPLRISEYGQVYRYERSGALSGLMRTRGFCQNDAHIYCRFDQAKDEFLRVMRLHARYYDLIGITDYSMRLSLPDLEKLDKYVNEPEKWLEALGIIRAAMQESGYPYEEAEGEAAFYGPKVDFMIKSVIGNEYAISTNQLDFMATSRFNLNYVGEDGDKHPVYVIHRAPLGSHERFVAFLIEHYAGAFPTWLSPVQARIIPISDRHVAYAEQVKTTLLSADIHNGTGGLRVDLDETAERMQKKIRLAQTEKIPYMLIIGDKEMENNQVAVRLRNGQDLGPMDIGALLERLRIEIDSRRDMSAE